MHNATHPINTLLLQKGYITVEEFMEAALCGYPASYYLKTEEIGSSGDFVTAPIVSPLFGYTLGTWVLDQIQAMQKTENSKINTANDKINIIELGPGNGVLMKNILDRIEFLDKTIYNKITVEMLDINPKFISQQKENLVYHINNISIKWVNNLDNLSNFYTSIFIANEFFDAIPIRQYIKSKNNIWHELVYKNSCEALRATTIQNKTRKQTLNFKDNQNTEDNFKLYLDKIDIGDKKNQALNQVHINAVEESIVEESPKSIEIIRKIANFLKTYHGIFIAIDYGYYLKPESRFYANYCSSLQAVKNHQYIDVTKAICDADLSAHVDFYAIESSLNQSGLTKYGNVISQAQFLIRNGILSIANECSAILDTSYNWNQYKVAANVQNQDIKWAQNVLQPAITTNISPNNTYKKLLYQQVNRLIDPGQMGELFKVLVSYYNH